MSFTIKGGFDIFRNQIVNIVLQKNNILHGDLPGNIMLDNSPEHKQNPIIIDWENAILNPQPIVKNIDMTAFVTSGFFKIK